MSKVFRALLAFILLPCIVFAAPKANPQMMKKAAHLLSRTTFGPTPEDIHNLAVKGEDGLKAWMESQLNPKSIVDTEVENKLKKLPSLSMSNQQLMENYPKVIKNDKKSKKDKNGTMKNPEESQKQILIELETQKLVRAAESKRQFQEVLVDFWFNHFNVDFNKGQDKWLITSYERDAIRPNVFGKFSDLLKATAKSPAMLFYLDNAQSVREGLGSNPKKKEKKKKQPKAKSKGLNENYARELLELHTLGVDGGYTQKDVIEVARVFTGWSINRKDEINIYEFKSYTHDKNAKKILGINFSANGGEEEGIKLLEMLAKNPETAKHIATKLAKRFISDTPSVEVVDRIAKKFISTDGDLTAVYREIFKSPEFWLDKNYSSKIKKPFHLIASTVRALDGKIEVDEAKGMRRLDQRLVQLGEPIYRCQPPTGFKEGAEFWVNSGALVTRIQTALTIAHHRVPSVDYETAFFRTKLRNAKVMDNNKEALKYLDGMILGSTLRPETIEKIATELNEVPAVQDEADAKIMEKEKNNSAKSSVNVPQLLGLLLGSPEFQRY